MNLTTIQTFGLGPSPLTPVIEEPSEGVTTDEGVITTDEGILTTDES